MSNTRKPFFHWVYYHVYNRWYMKRILFHSIKDFYKFETLIREYETLYPMIKVYTYCLLPNHFHFLMKQEWDWLYISDFMRRLQWWYANYYKVKYAYIKQRWISLYEWRFCAKILTDELDILRCNTYIINNPLKHKLVKNLDNRKFLSLRRPVS